MLLAAKPKAWHGTVMPFLYFSDYRKAEIIKHIELLHLFIRKRKRRF